jgi:hypothetical protein
VFGRQRSDSLMGTEFGSAGEREQKKKEERDGKEVGENEKEKEREGEGESESTVDRNLGLPSCGQQFCGRLSIGFLNDAAFCHYYLCSNAWLKIPCAITAMFLEQEGQEL